MRRRTLILAPLAATAASGAIQAQTFPSQPVRVVVPFPPGGGTDALARAIQEPMQKALGQPVIIDNKGGAGGNLAHEFAAKQPPDGHTVLFSSNNQMLYPLAKLSLTYPSAPPRIVVMANAVLSAPHFQDEGAAFDYVEAHLWPRGPVCPHCGETKRIGRLQGKTTRAGLRKCYACRKPFTVRIGTIFEDSHLPLHLWLQVMHLMSASKKGISTRQIQRMLQCSMKTAWHLTHRIRLAMAEGFFGPMGGEGANVEVDETYIGRKAGVPKRRGHQHKHTVVTLVERGGEARSFHVDNASAKEIGPILAKHIDAKSTLQTDEAKLYIQLGKKFANHQSVNHVSDEWVRGDAHTNTVEGFYSVFKRGMIGVYQHCDERHLHRYLAEFDFRYSNRQKLGVSDSQRASRALMGAKGKRLTYETLA